MSTIQIRNVPEEIHRTMKIRAAQAGQSLSDYLLFELRKLASYPTLNEWMKEFANTEPIELPPDATERAIAQSRAERESDLASVYTAYEPQAAAQ